MPYFPLWKNLSLTSFASGILATIADVLVIRQPNLAMNINSACDQASSLESKRRYIITLPFTTE